ncbi:ATP-binding cassette domain-containing protein [bacterium]|nr:ATP-binding cassette domain-containing protein [bacterium]
MISLDGVHKGFAGRTLLRDVSLRIGEGDRVGVVGPNGAGKSTLLAILRGAAEPDQGAVSRVRGASVGHLSQEILSTPDATVLETALRPGGRLARILDELRDLPDAIERESDPARQAAMAARLAELHAQQDELGGHDREARAKRILAGLGFAPGAEARPLRSFSGGYVMRAELARLLTDLPDLLLLDEPTNHLDLESVLWLQGFLARCPSTLVVISHDRAFLASLATSIVEVDGGSARRWNLGWEAWVEQRALERRQLEARAREQEKRLRETERFVERFRSKATKARQVQSRLKALEKEERIEVARESASVRIRFPQPPRTSDPVLELEGASKSWGEHRVHEGLDFVLRRGDKTVLVGPNGAGKSTLLKMLGGATPLDAGERRVGHGVTVGYYAQHREEMLDVGATVLQNALARVRDQGETTVRALLGSFLFTGDDVHKPASVLSGGEKSRLALALILLRPPSVLLMDEPTIHLDVPSVDALIAALVDFEGALGFVSHDVHFIRSVARRVVRIAGGRVDEYAGDWDYYLWRRARESEAAAEGTSAREAATPAEDALAGERSARGLRAERRQAAEARVALARRLRPLREEASRLEDLVDALEREKAGLEAELADPATYAAATGGDLAARNRRHAEVERELEAALARWEDVQGRIAEAESGPEEPGDDA